MKSLRWLTKLLKIVFLNNDVLMILPRVSYFGGNVTSGMQV